MLTELHENFKVVGAKEVKRAIEAGNAQRVFLADDAAPRIADPIAALCTECGVAVESGFSMKELGRACGIAVGSAVAAVVES